MKNTQSIEAVTPINFSDVFSDAFSTTEATNDYDRLITVLNLTVKAVKTERDRLVKDDLAHSNFANSVATVTELNDKMRDDSNLIDDYLVAAKAMNKAHNEQIARSVKSQPQWEMITGCFSKAYEMAIDLTPTENELQEAA